MKKIFIQKIIEETAKQFQICEKDIRSQSRIKNIVNARHAAMYLSRKLTKSSYYQIVLKFDKTDHSTCFHAVRKIEALPKTSDVYQKINKIKKELLK